MSYEFVSMEDAGKRTGDYILRLRWKPSQLRQCFGAREEDVTYYCRNDVWQAMDGSAVSCRVGKQLERIWQKYRQRAGADRGSPDWDQPDTSNAPSVSVDLVDLASEGSFPASDPPAWTLGR